jgi:hypothetical protein
MTTNFGAILTGESMMGKNTGGKDWPSRDEIARLAYGFYQARGRQDGQDVDDWLSAERQLIRYDRRTAWISGK